MFSCHARLLHGSSANGGLHHKPGLVKSMFVFRSTGDNHRVQGNGFIQIVSPRYLYFVGMLVIANRIRWVVDFLLAGGRTKNNKEEKRKK